MSQLQNTSPMYTDMWPTWAAGLLARSWWGGWRTFWLISPRTALWIVPSVALNLPRLGARTPSGAWFSWSTKIRSDVAITKNCCGPSSSCTHKAHLEGVSITLPRYHRSEIGLLLQEGRRRGQMLKNTNSTRYERVKDDFTCCTCCSLKVSQYNEHNLHVE